MKKYIYLSLMMASTLEAFLMLYIGQYVACIALAAFALGVGAHYKIALMTETKNESP